MGLSNSQDVLNRPAALKKAALYFILPFLFTGTILSGFLTMEAREEKKLHAAEQRSNIKLLISEVTNEFSIIASDLHLLASHHELKSFLETGEAIHLEGLKEEFVTFLKVLRRYRQVRLMDSAGVELLRVNNQEGEPFVVPSDALQNKGHRYYFKEIKVLKKGTIYFSRPDLNVEHGEIEIPAIPTIRAGIALFGLSKQNQGILVSNFKVTHLLRGLNEVVPPGIGQYLLVGSNDFWLQKSPDEGRWQLLVLDKKHQALKAGLPEGAWEEIIQSDSGQFDIQDGLATVRSFNPEDITDKHPISKESPKWQFVTVVPKQIFYARSSIILKRMLLVYALISLLLAGGSYIFATGTIRKETAEKALKRQEKEREALFEEMERKNAELEQFTYTVSHDLKSPLITIKGFLGLLEKDIASGKDAQIKDDISRISNAASKMKQLLEELLELSRIGRLVNPPQEVSLDNIVQEVVEVIAGIISKNKITIEISSSLPLILGDALRIREVFQNLLENAIRFMGDQSHPTIQIGSKVLKGKVVIYVRDNGIGLDPKYFKTVFGLFKRLDPTIEGTGVGLTLVKRIVEVHNGEIWIESEGSGRGCTFCFTLPTMNA